MQCINSTEFIIYYQHCILIFCYGKGILKKNQRIFDEFILKFFEIPVILFPLPAHTVRYLYFSSKSEFC